MAASLIPSFPLGPRVGRFFICFDDLAAARIAARNTDGSLMDVDVFIPIFSLLLYSTVVVVLISPTCVSLEL